MTCKEKYKQMFPGEKLQPFAHCPQEFGIVEKPSSGMCAMQKCKECWDREIPGTYKIDTKAEEAEFTYEHSGKPGHKVKDIFEENGGVTVVLEPCIKDSGNRTQFGTGAVRDMREGKGRCDLMPLEVVGWMLGSDNPDPIVYSIARFRENPKTEFLYDALNTFTGAYHNEMETMLLEVAKHFEEGAKKYGENNWQKGIPVHCYIDSAVRHYLKWLRGDKDEPHDRAFVWNLMCCIWEVDYRDKGKEETT